MNLKKQQHINGLAKQSLYIEDEAWFLSWYRILQRRKTRSKLAGTIMYYFFFSWEFWLWKEPGCSNVSNSVIFSSSLEWLLNSFHSSVCVFSCFFVHLFLSWGAAGQKENTLDFLSAYESYLTEEQEDPLTNVSEPLFSCNSFHYFTGGCLQNLNCWNKMFCIFFKRASCFVYVMFWFDIFLIADFHEQTVYLWQIWTAEPSNAKTDGKLPLYT